MVSCSEVLARHSEYIDGELTALEQEQWRTHLAGCRVCARYDKVLRKGLDLVAREPNIEPDPSFLLHMRYRLADEDQRRALRPMHASATAAVTVAAVLALAAWLPVLVLTGVEETAGETSTAARASLVDATEIAWHGGRGVEASPSHVRLASRTVSLTPAHVDVSLIERGFTPVIIEAPTAPPSYTRVSLTSQLR